MRKVFNCIAFQSSINKLYSTDAIASFLFPEEELFFALKKIILLSGIAIKNKVSCLICVKYKIDTRIFLAI
jgi:hypothetical protein